MSFKVCYALLHICFIIYANILLLLQEAEVCIYLQKEMPLQLMIRDTLHVSKFPCFIIFSIVYSHHDEIDILFVL